MKEVINLQGEKVQVPVDTPVKTVNGVHYLLSQAEQDEIAAREAVWQAESVKRNALAKILRLEAEAAQPRRIREAILGTDNGWLAAQEALIATERAKL